MLELLECISHEARLGKLAYDLHLCRGGAALWMLGIGGRVFRLPGHRHHEGGAFGLMHKWGHV